MTLDWLQGRDKFEDKVKMAEGTDGANRHGGGEQTVQGVIGPDPRAPGEVGRRWVTKGP